MEKVFTINKTYNSLDTLLTFLKKETPLECFKDYDHWELRTTANGQMEECLVIQKSAMHAIKLYFTEDNTVRVNYIIPNKIMNAYFGKSVKAHRNILEIVIGKVMELALATPQRKAFDELEQIIQKAA